MNTNLSVKFRSICSPLVNKIQRNEDQFDWEVGVCVAGEDGEDVRVNRHFKGSGRWERGNRQKPAVKYFIFVIL